MKARFVIGALLAIVAVILISSLWAGEGSSATWPSYQDSVRLVIHEDPAATLDQCEQVTIQATALKIYKMDPAVAVILPNSTTLCADKSQGRLANVRGHWTIGQTNVFFWLNDLFGVKKLTAKIWIIKKPVCFAPWATIDNQVANPAIPCPTG